MTMSGESSEIVEGVGMDADSVHKDTPTQLGKELRARREASGFTLAEMAQRIGHTAGHLSQIERGAIRAPSAEVLARVAVGYGMSPLEAFVLAIPEDVRDEFDLTPGLSPDDLQALALGKNLFNLLPEPQSRAALVNVAQAMATGIEAGIAVQNPESI